MYHGIPINTEFFALVFGAIVWIIRQIIRGLKQLRKPDPAAPLSQSPAQLPRPGQQAGPPSPAPMQGQSPPRESPPQKPPVRPAIQARPRERQPQAGGPAVPTEATRRDFERQEQDLFASEPAALSAPLSSAPAGPAVSANALLGSTDDLIRAIILQEVLGPPLSRRAPRHSQSSIQSPPASASPQ